MDPSNVDPRITDFISQVAIKTFPSFAKLPYNTAQPEKWIFQNVENAFSEGEPNPKNDFKSQFGEATYHLYGSPTFRVFEINLGFAKDYSYRYIIQVFNF